MDKFIGFLMVAASILFATGCGTTEAYGPNGQFTQTPYSKKVDTREAYEKCKTEFRNAYGAFTEERCHAMTDIPLNGGSQGGMMMPGGLPYGAFTAGISLGGMSPNAYGPVTLMGDQFSTIDPQLAAMRDTPGTAGVSNASGPSGKAVTAEDLKPIVVGNDAKLHQVIADVAAMKAAKKPAKK